jgi:hypothetical protein
MELEDMSSHEYTAAEALRLLIDKVANADKDLAVRIQQAIDAGNDIQEEEKTSSGRKRKRVYRKHVAYTDEEALNVAINVLKAHFYEFPKIVNAAIDSFKDSRVGPTKRLLASEKGNITWDYSTELPDDLFEMEKSFEIEVETETTQSKEQRPNQILKHYDPSSIGEIEERVKALREHLVF